MTNTLSKKVNLIAESIEIDYMPYIAETEYPEESKIIMSNGTGKDKAIAIIKKACEKNWTDWVQEIINTILIYTSDQEAILADYGISKAISEYQNEIGNIPKDNSIAILASATLERAFFDHYSFDDVFNTFIKNFQNRVRLSGRKTYPKCKRLNILPKNAHRIIAYKHAKKFRKVSTKAFRNAVYGKKIASENPRKAGKKMGKAWKGML